MFIGLRNKCCDNRFTSLTEEISPMNFEENNLIFLDKNSNSNASAFIVLMTGVLYV